MSEWFENLEGIRAQVWTRLGVVRSQIALGTISADGWPEVRTVVLRGADPVEQVIEVYTDIKSDKINSLRASPRAALHLWDADLALQIRVQADVKILTGDDVKAQWDTVPDHARQSYGVTPPPGQVIAQALDYRKTSLFDDFAVLSCTVQHIDAVHLGDVHRRAAFSRVGEWGGNWLVP